MTDGMWQMSRPDLEARVAELEAEKQKAAQEWLHLDAANRTLIDENKRLRECADVMAERLEDAYSQMAGGCECYKWTEIKRAADDYRAAFPREEAKPTVIQPKSGPYDAKDVIDVKEAKP